MHTWHNKAIYKIRSKRVFALDAEISLILSFTIFMLRVVYLWEISFFKSSAYTKNFQYRWFHPVVIAVSNPFRG